MFSIRVGIPKGFADEVVGKISEDEYNAAQKHKEQDELVAFQVNSVENGPHGPVAPDYLNEQECKEKEHALGAEEAEHYEKG